MPPKFLETDIFADLRRKGGYYVDKTIFLEEFLRDPAKATLITRPRRFGKSLFMSMLAEFFDIKKQGNKPNLFEGLSVSANENLCKEWLHQYPVILITLKDINKSTYSDTLTMIQDIIGEICIENNYLLNSNSIDPEECKEFKLLYSKKSDTATLEKSLFTLTKVMCKHYGKQAILLIDEYDVPVAKAAEKGYYDKMIEFMRGFFSRALKSNPYLNFAILTGALRITKESIFTGLNNLDCFDISSSRHSDIFGFTQDEVDKLLAAAGCEDRRDIIREWYDGYHFGKRQDIYCPWSITKYLRELQTEPEEEPKAYWRNTSGNALARDFARRLPDAAKVHGHFAALLAGDPIAVTLNPCMNYTDIFTSADNFWTLLYLTGYLTLASESELQGNKKNKRSLLVIPNEEVREVFQTELEVLLQEILPESLRTALCDALWKKDAQDLEKQLGAMLRGCSFHDATEAWYHGMMYGLLRPIYKDTDSNKEIGDGRCDIYLPDSAESRAAVLEFKRVSAEGKLEAGVRAALKQIEEKKYDERARKEGYATILWVGIAFFGKSVKVGIEEVRGESGCIRAK